jgi:ribosomal protein S18 acetylase RimI-like enzyme
MAARLHPALPAKPEIIDLRCLSTVELDPLLREESAAWRDELDWDFEKSADLVRRFVDLRALNGSALLEGTRVTGYVYYVLEENKGLIGDLYVSRAVQSREREDWLLQAALDPMVTCSPNERVECQLMLLGPGHEQRPPYPEFVTTFERNFMRLNLRKAPLREGRLHRQIFVERWSDQYQEAAAHLIATAYKGHIDSRINDQYRSVEGARRFLYNIVQYPGCGTFYRPASYAAFEAESGRLCGISLTSLVALDCGHITQICVSKEVRGTGVGYDLLRRSLTTLRDAQCRSASLTVTAANLGAVQLYEQTGFETLRRFQAYVWEGFGRASSMARRGF